MSSITSNATEDVSLPASSPQTLNETTDKVDLPQKSSEVFSYQRCSPSLRSKHAMSTYGVAPNSLSKLISGRSSLKSHTSVGFDIEERLRKSKEITFDPFAACAYGYGVDDSTEPKLASSNQEPANKRRRFQRRNSKTPAMLMAMNSPLLLHLDFLEDQKEKNKKAASPNASFAPNSWDGGLEIAEELVMHLQKRRGSKP